MKLSLKLVLIFLASLIVSSVIIVLGLPSIFTQISRQQMEQQARTFGHFLLLNIESISIEQGIDYESDEDVFEDLVFDEFKKAIRISKETGSFLVDKIILVNPAYKVEVGYPAEEKGADYSQHDDIVENFIQKKFSIVLEKEITDEGEELDADIVSYLEMNDSEPRVLEIKLNFEKTMELLRSRYRTFELISVLLSFFIILIMMGILLLMIRQTAIKPILKISRAMEMVGKGQLDVSVEHKSGDEFGMMSRRFNEMVTGLKEKLHLSRYVSLSTIDAVSNAIKSGESFHKPRRKVVTVFFSDIRGFTSYSEKRNPEDIIGILNILFSLQAEVIKKNGGYIDKFVGDEAMAIFNNAADAITTALYIQYNIKQKPEDFDGLRIGIGIFEGEVVEGDVGSEDTKDYTIIGDTVNTAARLESVAEGGEIVVPEAIIKKEEIAGRFRFKPKGNIKLKGKEETLALYRITAKISKSGKNIQSSKEQN